MFICDNQLLLFEDFSECMKVKWRDHTSPHSSRQPYCHWLVACCYYIHESISNPL
jgi:hypothetical protein